MGTGTPAPSLPRPSHRRLPACLAVLLLATGCSSPHPKVDPDLGGLVEESEEMSRHQGELVRDLEKLRSPAPTRNTEGELAGQSAELSRRQQRLLETLQRRDAPPPSLAPVLPEYNPLDDIMVSLEMDNTDVRHVLIALAKETGMNLLLHPELLHNPPHISITFRNVPASTVFREVLRIADLYGRVENNVLRVDPFQEEVFHLDFLETNTVASFSAGGNVLGTGAGEGDGGGQLTGTYQVSGGNQNTNPYTELNAILGGIIAGKGNYQLNPLSGLLYVRAKPSAIRTVSDLVNRYKQTMGRQVSIDARILEVRLTDNFQAGIDWAEVRSNLLFSFGLSQTLTGNVGAITAAIANTAPDVPENNLGITYRGDSTLAVIRLLKQYGNVKVISNPTIRAKHSQPAMISVGQSNAYVRESNVTTTTTGGNVTTEADVTVDSVFDGLLVGVTPFITEDGRISLAIHPVQSAVDAASLQLVNVGGNTQVSLPSVDLKEMSTVLELRDGDTVMLGGLIDKRRTRTRDGVPVLSEVPVAGRAFKSDADLEVVRELVIVLRVTIL